MQHSQTKNKKTKIYCVLIAMCFSMLFCSCGNNKPPAEMPADFDFILDFNYAFTVDTYEKTLTETDKYTMETAYQVKFSFTDKQLENIYAEFVDLNIYKIENGTDVGEIEVIPPIGVFLTYTMNGETISIQCTDNYLSGRSKKEKKNFVAFTDFIIAYIAGSEEYIDAPHIPYAFE